MQPSCFRSFVKVTRILIYNSVNPVHSQTRLGAFFKEHFQGILHQKAAARICIISSLFTCNRSQSSTASNRSLEIDLRHHTRAFHNFLFKKCFGAQVASSGRQHQRRFPVAVLLVQLHFVHEAEVSDQVQLAGYRTQVQRSLTEAVSCVRVGAGVNKQSHDVRAALESRPVDRSVPLVVDVLWRKVRRRFYDRLAITKTFA